MSARILYEREIFIIGAVTSLLARPRYKNKIPIKQYMQEYNDLNDEEFLEGQRRKLIKLKLEIDSLRKLNSRLFT